MKLRKDRKYPHMYWIVFDTGLVSYDYYNIVWALEHIRRHKLGEVSGYEISGEDQ